MPEASKSKNKRFSKVQSPKQPTTNSPKESEATEVPDGITIPVGYLCACGFATPGGRALSKHMLGSNKKEHGKHHSRGVWDFKAKKPLFKPEKERTPEEQARFKRWREEPSGVPGRTSKNKGVLRAAYARIRR